MNAHTPTEIDEKLAERRNEFERAMRKHRDRHRQQQARENLEMGGIVLMVVVIGGASLVLQAIQRGWL